MAVKRKPERGSLQGLVAPQPKYHIRKVNATWVLFAGKNIENPVVLVFSDTLEEMIGLIYNGYTLREI